MQFLKKSQAPNGNYFQVWVNTSGVKKRCRKVSRELLDLGYISLEKGEALKELSSDHETIKSIEAQAVAVVKGSMRKFSENASISFNKIEIGDNFTRALLFDDANFNHALQVA